MKKLGNVLYWSISLGAILVGLVLMTVGVSLGGATSFSINSNGLALYSDFAKYDVDDLTMESITITDLVNGIKLDGDLSEIHVTSGDELAISHSGNVNYTVRNNTLEINSQVKLYRKFGISMTSGSQNLLKLTVPDYVRTLEVDTSGAIKILGLELDLIDLEIALGDITIEDTVATNLDLEANLGNVTLDTCKIGTLDAELNLGALATKKLEVLTSATFENNMGAMEIDLTGDEADYTFVTTVNMGACSINGNKNLPTNGPIIISTETAMGSVSITTK